ncbi:4Fe-4S dicluster domain-containing protein [Trichlorobacter lovleyi]|uniref:4Fe-4S ferredoxin iron-sulfur binding domain protein n=1 Tax=Trichlorobacter lovleyi (strain ATCC BAA-1151 / DSM 17278 / SZ) TaxID=398767 RepID=B3E715_TRIL1|nr:4Fe-4S binding protein [Trichlorobacter lovleyi]ACD96420.1 4Fe-4S ferredoxin iron-sulfur binding domain protein [Trichlorobacter lovleyi SZ]
MPDTTRQPKAAPLIDTRRCSGCGRCVAVCPERIITLETTHHRKHAVITEPHRCTTCGRCITVCPLEAISSSPF